MSFNAEREITHICDWIKEYFVQNGPEAKAIIGMSGGKDSTIAAALLVRALGPERVIGVRIPDGIQRDKDMSLFACHEAGILPENCIEVNIKTVMNELYNVVDVGVRDLPVVYTNTPARIRMTILYMIAGKYHGRVVNTCNYSEDYVGYSTKYGDGAGDFGIFTKYCVREVLAIGDALNIPAALVHKPPEDGMSGKTDEDNLGFSYKELDDLLLDNIVPDYEIYKNIRERHRKNIHKLDAIKLPHPNPIRNMPYHEWSHSEEMFVF